MKEPAPRHPALVDAWRTVALASDPGDRREAFQQVALAVGAAVDAGEIDQAEATDDLIELGEQHEIFAGIHARENLEHVVAQGLAGIRALPVHRPREPGEWAPNSPWNPANVQGSTIDATLPPILTKREFIEGFIPPDYLVDGILQRGFVYSLTAATGHGKTAVALLMARLVGRSEGEAHFGSHEVDRGRGAYFAGENPDDLRIRIIGDDAKSGRDGRDDNIIFIPGVFDIAQMKARLENSDVGALDLVIVDTSAAYFLGNDEMSNTQMGAHARLLRTLTTLPGHPTVLVLCHPIKHAAEPAHLLPRGGGAFLAEVDGNLTLWKKDESLVELYWHGKLRGPGFEPMTFRLEKVETTALTDSKGRLIPTVRAVPITDTEEETQAQVARRDEDTLLAAMLTRGRSVADLAEACGWLLTTGKPYKSKVTRVMERLEKSGLAKIHREQWQLTEAGKTAASAAGVG